MRDERIADRLVERRGVVRGRWAHTYAALDLGTNNCRLLVARPAGNGFRVLDAFSRIVRLGEGVSERAALTEPAMARTIDALKVCARKMRRSGVTRARSVATEACRRAANREDFLRRVRYETGVVIDTIDAQEEARLALGGCVPLFHRGTGYALLFDIGGGSTQLLWLRIRNGDSAAVDAEVVGALSVACGVVGLSERFGGDRVDPGTYEAICQHVDALIRPFDVAYRIGEQVRAGNVQMVGTSGTVTTLAGVHLGLDRYDRSRVDGVPLSFDDIAATSLSLAELDYAGRAALPCVGPDRADLVVGGCAVLEAICRIWPVGRLRVGDRGLRDGILLDLMAEADREEATPLAGGAVLP
ncbi:MAG: Ppx/GppA phosphatase family protein [Alphaproteobacteria bacterium]